MKRPIVVFACALIVALLFSPLILAAGWHALYGSHASYLGKTVRVPADWIVMPRKWKSSTDLTIMQLPRMLLFDRSHNGFISFYETLPRNHSFNEARSAWERTMDIKRHMPGVTVVGPLSVGEPGQQSACVKITHSDSKDAMEISCLLFNGKWMASYIGSSREAEDFLDVVRSIQ